MSRRNFASGQAYHRGVSKHSSGVDIIELRTLAAYAIIALLIAGAVALSYRLQSNSRKLRDQRHRRHRRTDQDGQIR